MATQYLLSPETRQDVPTGLDQLARLEPHPQLLLDKWIRVGQDGMRFSLRDDRDQTPRKDSLNAVAKASAALTAPDPEALARRERHFTPPLRALGEDGAAGTYYQDVETRSPLALHLSRSNPLENAAACLHRQWGCPYLMGSGLKGAARNAALYRLNDRFPSLLVSPGETGGAHQIRYDLEALPEARRRDAAEAVLAYALIYGLSPNDGDTGGKGVRGDLDRYDQTSALLERLAQGLGYDLDAAPLDAFAGAVIFWDALPPAGARAELKVDVLTPHAGKYYQGQPVPDERQSPIPVTFLVAEGTFRVAVSLRRLDGRLGQPMDGLIQALGAPAHFSPQGLLQTAAEDLNAALSEWGFGAKTAAGYGQLRPSTARNIQGPAEAPQTASPEDEAALEAFIEGLAGRDLSPSDPHARGDVQREVISEFEALQGAHPPVADGAMAALRHALEGAKLSRALKQFLK